jgi:hypothetical protein
MRVLSFDVSMNHGGATLIKNERLKHYWYFTDVVASAKRCKGHGTLLPKKPKSLNNKDSQQYQMFRLNFVRNWVRAVVRVAQPDYIGIEDYALHAANKAHQLGEVGGAARIIFWDSGVPFRCSDPVSCKMFTAHDGTAQKDLIERSVRERWGVDFTHCNPPQQPGKNMNRTVSEDLSDAFGLGKLVETEAHLRLGLVTLKMLHPKEIQVFTRITKTFPCNILDREWLQGPRRKAA